MGRSKGEEEIFHFFCFCCLSFGGWKEFTKELMVDASAKDSVFLSPVTWASADNQAAAEVV